MFSNLCCYFEQPRISFLCYLNNNIIIYNIYFFSTNLTFNRVGICSGSVLSIKHSRVSVVRKDLTVFYRIHYLYLFPSFALCLPSNISLTNTTIILFSTDTRRRAILSVIYHFKCFSVFIQVFILYLKCESK